MPNQFDEYVKSLKESAKDAHDLLALANFNGWKLLKEKLFEVIMQECQDYVNDTKNTDMCMIQAKRELRNFIQTMLDEITTQIDEGLKHEKELNDMEKKKGKEGKDEDIQ